MRTHADVQTYKISNQIFFNGTELFHIGSPTDNQELFC